MIQVLFVCHGNICRSPMAEFIFKAIVKAQGRTDFRVDSAATSRSEIGEPVYPPVAALLAERGIDCSAKRARQITRADYEQADWVIVMDQRNLDLLPTQIGADDQHKVHLLLSFCGRPGEAVDDPWYTRDFRRTWDEIEAGCRGLYEHLIELGGTTHE